nr:MAG TPA: hypothetical protein [Caudoviricetes sp.]
MDKKDLRGGKRTSQDASPFSFLLIIQITG